MNLGQVMSSNAYKCNFRCADELPDVFPNVIILTANVTLVVENDLSKTLPEALIRRLID